jgi:4-hydroxyphenylpyruvate dioxygenase
VAIEQSLLQQQIRDIAYVEMYVGNMRQAAHFLHSTYGLKPVASAGLETGRRDATSMLLVQGEIRILLTEPLDSQGPIADFIKRHGDGIHDIALSVDDCAGCFEAALRRGARAVAEPTSFEGPTGRITKATIAAYGDVVHSFVQREGAGAHYMPHFRPIDRKAATIDPGLLRIDHIAVSLEPGTLDEWVDFYTGVLDFKETHAEEVITEYSGMNSKVVQNSHGTIKFPMQQPIRGKRKSQIEEYLSYNHGPGAQHLAFLCKNIIAAVQVLRERGIEFLPTPAAYYESITDRVGTIDEELALLKELHILVDRDSTGYLLQLFTTPLQGRPTLFIELIQRKNACGFGSGNIKALFAAVEREQAMRGNL